jgi:hypothetical protein
LANMLLEESKRRNEEKTNKNWNQMFYVEVWKHENWYS